MKKALIAGILALSMSFTGCTAAQKQEATEVLIQVLQNAEKALDVLADNPKAIEQAQKALTALARITPDSGPIHEAIVQAQAALVALQKNQGNLRAVQAALELVVSLLEEKGSIPLGVARHRSAGVAPVNTQTR